MAAWAASFTNWGPSKFGYQAVRAVLEVGVPMIDLSFCPEDLMELNGLAKKNGTFLISDCGLAPGLSNLIVGYEFSKREVENIKIMVGGVAKDIDAPYGYKVSWSVDDLLEEYTRPARIRIDGENVQIPTLTNYEVVNIPGVGIMEAFCTDGLRSLLRIHGPKNLVEKTLRWRGHVDQIKPLIRDGTFVETITRECQNGEDLVVMRIEMDDDVIQTVIKASDGISAMSRGTALTTAMTARLVLEDDVFVNSKGVYFMEDFLPEESMKLLEMLETRAGVAFNWFKKGEE